MIIRLKDGVSLDHCHGKMYHAISIATQVWQQCGAHELWITGGREHGHTTNPDVSRQFHWLPDGSCQAIDLRTHNLSEGKAQEAQRLLARLLGPEYDVLLEHPGEDNEHIHVQYDPMRLGTV